MTDIVTQEEISLGILGYWDENEEAWTALALEMDLRGYGSTFEEALEDLRELVIMQVSFALSKEQPEMIWKPSDPSWFELLHGSRKIEA